MDVKSWGDIAVDDIKVLNGVSMTDCKGEAFFLVHGHNVCILDVSAACERGFLVKLVYFGQWI